jgi:hypothetical protein
MMDDRCARKTDEKSYEPRRREGRQEKRNDLFLHLPVAHPAGLCGTVFGRCKMNMRTGAILDTFTMGDERFSATCQRLKAISP